MTLSEFVLLHLASVYDLIQQLVFLICKIPLGPVHLSPLEKQSQLLITEPLLQFHIIIKHLKCLYMLILKCSVFFAKYLKVSVMVNFNCQLYIL